MINNNAIEMAMINGLFTSKLTRIYFISDNTKVIVVNYQFHLGYYIELKIIAKVLQRYNKDITQTLAMLINLLRTFNFNFTIHISSLVNY